MHFGVLHLSPDLGTDNINLLSRVSQLASEECIGKSFEALGDLQVIPGTNFFLFMTVLVSRRSYTCPGESYQMLVCRPGPHWPNETFSLDIFEASILHPAFKKWARARLHLGSSRRVEEHVVELERGGIRLQRVIRGRPCEIKIDTFDPSAGSGVTGCWLVSMIVAERVSRDAYSMHCLRRRGQSLIALPMNLQCI